MSGYPVLFERRSRRPLPASWLESNSLGRMKVFAAWAQRVEVPFEGENGVLALQTGSVQGEEAAQAFLLDLDFATLKPQEVALDQAMGWVDQAHGVVENAFEECITDKARELFKEVRRDRGKASAR